MSRFRNGERVRYVGTRPEIYGRVGGFAGDAGPQFPGRVTVWIDGEPWAANEVHLERIEDRVVESSNGFVLFGIFLAGLLFATVSNFFVDTLVVPLAVLAVACGGVAGWAVWFFWTRPPVEEDVEERVEHEDGSVGAVSGRTR